MNWRPRLIPGGRAPDDDASSAQAVPADRSDAELVADVLDEGVRERARHDAYAVLVRRHEQAVLRVARNLLRDGDAARDAAQDAFLRAYRSLATWRPELSFRNWLLRIAVNAAHDIQARDDRPRLRPLDEGLHVAAIDGGPAEVDASVALERVRRSLDALSPREREVFVLREMEGLDVEEIGRLLDLEAPTVRRHLARARLRLREILGG